MDRSLPVHHIYRWDLDKTYLHTEFDTLADLVRTALQGPEDKRNVPGVVTLVHELMRQEPHSRAMLTFISGSPSQMRHTLERKFALDGIAPDQFVLKPTLQELLRGRFRALRGQVGYKLHGLLAIRQLAPQAPETLFGDDAEQDAFIYSLYADLAAGILSHGELAPILELALIYPDTQRAILQKAREMRVDGNVGRIFIHLDRQTPPGRFWVFGPRLVPIFNYFQAALVLFGDRVIEASGVARVALGMMRDSGFSPLGLAQSFQDLVRRRHVDPETPARLEHSLAPGARAKSGEQGWPGSIEELLRQMRALVPPFAHEAPQWQGPTDYLALLKADRRLSASVQGRTPWRGLLGPRRSP